MENCFRFLINVDQCLNMSNFDIFFYKLESQHKFHLQHVQLFGGDYGSSLRNAITDIRMYLDKYPYHVGDFQIIVAMRGAFTAQPERWEQTMLYRLLQLSCELRNARIFINSREQTEKALNLIMLYDADFSVELPILGDYLTSARYQSDYELLLQHLKLDEASSQTQVEQALDAYMRDAAHDAALADLMQKFTAFKRKQLSDFAAVEAEQTDIADYQNEPFLSDFPAVLKEQLTNFQVFEANIDRNNRRQNILALLRITEFINMSVERPLQAGDNIGVVTLAQQCRDNWNKVWNDKALETHYASMLHRYQKRLHIAITDLEQPRFHTPAAKALPEERIPAPNEISGPDADSGKDAPNDQSDFTGILTRFIERKFSVRTIQKDWDEVYLRIKNTLSRMDYALKTYAEELSRQYAAILEERKRDSLLQKTGFFVAKPDTEQNISRLAHEREELLRQLRSPHMNPTIRFQDQLNMENALEQANLSIRFYLQCISAIRAVGFLILIGVCALMCFGHYSFLQPYALSSAYTLVYYLVYLGSALTLMLLCWNMPYRYFRRKLKRRIQALQKDMEVYCTGYAERKQNFGSYINLLNQLDYVTRYHHLLCRAYNTSHRLSQGYLWHKIQLRRHLSKLQAFQGLIDLVSMTEPDTDASSRFIPAINGDQVSDVVDSPIYWPQG